MSFTCCNLQELSWTHLLHAEWTPSGFQCLTCVSTRMAECVRTAYLTVMLLYLLDTASSIYPRIRLTHKGKRKNPRHLFCDAFITPTNKHEPTYIEQHLSVALTFIGLARQIFPCQCRAHRQSEVTDVFIASLWQHTELVAAQNKSK